MTLIVRGMLFVACTDCVVIRRELQTNIIVFELETVSPQLTSRAFVKPLCFSCISKYWLDLVYLADEI